MEVAKNFFAGGGIMILLGGLISTMSRAERHRLLLVPCRFRPGARPKFPRHLRPGHNGKHTPHWAILFSMLIVVLMAVSLPIEDVASSADIMFLLLFLQVNLAAISLRKKRPELDRGFVIPLFPGLSIFGIALLLFLAVYMFTYSPKAWIVTAIWIGMGLIFYRSYASKREVQYVRKVRLLKRIEKREYRILTCLANPTHIADLSHLAKALAIKNQAEVIFLHVIDVDEGQPLAAGLDQTGPVRPILAKAESEVATLGLPARSIVTVSHGVPAGHRRHRRGGGLQPDYPGPEERAGVLRPLGQPRLPTRCWSRPPPKLSSFTAASTAQAA